MSSFRVIVDNGVEMNVPVEVASDPDGDDHHSNNSSSSSDRKKNENKDKNDNSKTTVKLDDADVAHLTLDETLDSAAEDALLSEVSSILGDEYNSTRQRFDYSLTRPSFADHSVNGQHTPTTTASRTKAASRTKKRKAKSPSLASHIVATNATHRREVKEWKERSWTYQQKLQVSESTVIEQRAQLRELRAALKAKNKKLRFFHGSNERLREAHDQAQRELKARGKYVATLEARLRTAMKLDGGGGAKAFFAHEAASLAAKAKQLKQHNDELREEVQSSADTIKALRTEVRVLRGALNQHALGLAANDDDDDTGNNNDTNHHHHRHHQQQQQQQHRNASSSSSSSLLIRTSQMQQELQVARRDAVQARQQVMDMREREQRSGARIQQLEAQLKRLASAYETMRNEARTDSKERQNLLDYVEDVLGKLTRAQKDNEELKRSLDEALRANESEARQADARLRHVRDSEHRWQAEAQRAGESEAALKQAVQRLRDKQRVLEALVQKQREAQQQLLRFHSENLNGQAAGSDSTASAANVDALVSENERQREELRRLRKHNKILKTQVQNELSDMWQRIQQQDQQQQQQQQQHQQQQDSDDARYSYGDEYGDEAPMTPSLAELADM